jgi:site-specific DNA-methyltransferase (adenine-specific)
MVLKNKIYNQDCLEFLKKQNSEIIDLIITSPPYADQRKKTYGGISVNEYVDWFLPISLELKRVLKPKGSFVLNIKEKTVNGERATYVLELILEMRKQGWLWVEEYVWHKKNSFPGKWPNRFRDSWERCLHFTKEKKFEMYQDEVKIPMGDWAETRLKKLSKTDRIRDESQVKSGFGKNVSNWIGKESVYPTNVLHMATECGNVNHSAAFPVSLPSWFIKLFTKEKDIVLDPFMGSGSTALASINLNRYFIGTEVHEEYYKTSLSRIKELDKQVKKSQPKSKTTKRSKKK